MIQTFSRWPFKPLVFSSDDAPCIWSMTVHSWPSLISYEPGYQDLYRTKSGWYVIVHRECGVERARPVSRGYARQWLQWAGAPSTYQYLTYAMP